MPDTKTDNLTYIGFTDKEAKIYFRWRQFQDIWERLFDDKFTGALKIDKAECKPDIYFKWETGDRRSLSTTLPIDR